MNALAHPTLWRHRHYNKDGLLLWGSGIGDVASEGILRATDEEVDAILAQKWDPNTVTSEGQRWILEAAFRNNPEAGNGGTLTGFEIGLSTSGALAETSTYATRAEHTDTTGYAGQTVARSTAGFAAATGTNPVGAKTPATGTYTFTATGTWTAVLASILFTAGLTTNILIAYAALSVSRSLVNGDTLDTDMTLTADGA